MARSWSIDSTILSIFESKKKVFFRYRFRAAQNQWKSIEKSITFSTEKNIDNSSNMSPKKAPKMEPKWFQKSIKKSMQFSIRKIAVLGTKMVPKWSQNGDKNPGIPWTFQAFLLRRLQAGQMEAKELQNEGKMEPKGSQIERKSTSKRAEIDNKIR